MNQGNQRIHSEFRLLSEKTGKAFPEEVEAIHAVRFSW